LSRPGSSSGGTSTSVNCIRCRRAIKGKVGMGIKDNAISSRQRSSPGRERLETIVITDIWAFVDSYSSDLPYYLIGLIITVRQREQQNRNDDEKLTML
jgi:hypothetical protein